jgi:hypothetical protein
MPLELVADSQGVSAAIDGFSPDYHQDFEDVRSIAVRYLEQGDPDALIVVELSRRLRCALRAWGASGRAAPAVQPEAELVKVLCDTAIHAQLQRLGSLSLTDLTIANGRRTFRSNVVSWSVAEFDDAIVTILNQLSERLLIANSNVTYPMKAMLLLTGLMPALDSQVRDGLSLAGLGGLRATQFPMPLDVNTAGGKKVTRLPFILGQCLEASGGVLRAGCLHRRHVELAASPGRLFDVLFFIQGSKGRRIFELSGKDSAWYALQ